MNGSLASWEEPYDLVRSLLDLSEHPKVYHLDDPTGRIGKFFAKIQKISKSQTFLEFGVQERSSVSSHGLPI